MHHDVARHGNRARTNAKSEGKREEEEGEEADVLLGRLTDPGYANRKSLTNPNGEKAADRLFSQLLPFQPPATTRDRTFPSALVGENPPRPAANFLARSGIPPLTADSSSALDGSRPDRLMRPREFPSAGIRLLRGPQKARTEYRGRVGAGTSIISRNESSGGYFLPVKRAEPQEARRRV